MASAEKQEYWAGIIAERLYLDDDGTIRKRAAVLHPSVDVRGELHRHQAYVNLVNRQAHQPVSEKSRGSVRIHKAIEVREEFVREVLVQLGPAQREPRQVVCPDGMYPNTRKREKPSRDVKKAARKTMMLVDGVVVWRRIDETQAGYLHPALEGLGAGWNKRYAEKPVTVRSTSRSGHEYIRVAGRDMRVSEVVAILEEAANG